MDRSPKRVHVTLPCAHTRTVDTRKQKTSPTWPANGTRHYIELATVPAHNSYFTYGNLQSAVKLAALPTGENSTHNGVQTVGGREEIAFRVFPSSLSPAYKRGQHVHVTKEESLKVPGFSRFGPYRFLDSSFSCSFFSFGPFFSFSFIWYCKLLFDFRRIKPINTSSRGPQTTC